MKLITPADVSVYHDDYTSGWGLPVTNVGGSPTGPIMVMGVDPYKTDNCIDTALQ